MAPHAKPQTEFRNFLVKNDFLNQQLAAQYKHLYTEPKAWCNYEESKSYRLGFLQEGDGHGGEGGGLGGGLRNNESLNSHSDI